MLYGQGRQGDREQQDDRRGEDRKERPNDEVPEN